MKRDYCVQSFLLTPVEVKLMNAAIDMPGVPLRAIRKVVGLSQRSALVAMVSLVAKGYLGKRV